MANIRGSGAYWSKTTADLTAMARYDPPVMLFVFFTFADIYSPEVFEIISIEPFDNPLR